MPAVPAVPGARRRCCRGTEASWLPDPSLWNGSSCSRDLPLCTFVPAWFGDEFSAPCQPGMIPSPWDRPAAPQTLLWGVASLCHGGFWQCWPRGPPPARMGRPAWLQPRCSTVCPAGFELSHCWIPRRAVPGFTASWLLSQGRGQRLVFGSRSCCLGDPQTLGCALSIPCLLSRDTRCFEVGPRHSGFFLPCRLPTAGTLSVLADPSRHPGVAPRGGRVPAGVARVWWDLLVCYPGLGAVCPLPEVPAPGTSGMSTGPGCRGEGTFGCPLEPSGSSCQALPGAGPHRSESRAFFTRLCAGLRSAGPAAAAPSLPRLEKGALSGAELCQQPQGSLGGVQEQGWVWAAGRAEQIPAVG